MILVVLTAILVYYKDNNLLDYSQLELNKDITLKTFDNYGESASKAAKKHGVPAEYILALIALECSGRKIIPHRFEPHIYEKLDLIAHGKLASMESVTYPKIKGLHVAQLRDLASSWGPFQIMGYKSLEIGVNVKSFEGANSVDIGTKWIKNEYGHILDKKDFKSAFHLHNTGRTYPKFGPPRTYHKEYIPRGLKYMEKFKEMLDNQASID